MSFKLTEKVIVNIAPTHAPDTIKKHTILFKYIYIYIIMLQIHTYLIRRHGISYKHRNKIIITYIGCFHITVDKMQPLRAARVRKIILISFYCTLGH